MTIYKLVKVLDENLVVLVSSYGEQMWSRMTVPQRTHKVCQLCDEELIGQRSFRPITNLSNRMHRICADCIQFMIMGRAMMQLMEHENDA